MPSFSRRLEGKTALITGATAGMGRVVVERFINEGARVVFCGRREQAGHELAERLGDRVRFIRADVTKADDVLELVTQSNDWLGSIDILFNNAASPTRDRPVAEIVYDELQYDMTSIFGSVVLVTSRVAPIMAAQGKGSIINNASTAAHRANSSPAIYSALKAAVCHFSRCMALELAERGIRVNTISPGAIVTPIFLGQFGIPVDREVPALAALRSAFAAALPLGRAGEPEDVAAAAVYFASDESSYVTGQDLVVDGGLTAGLSAAARRQQSAALAIALKGALD